MCLLKHELWEDEFEISPSMLEINHYTLWFDFEVVVKMHKIDTPILAVAAISQAWSEIVTETRQIQGSELHYQAMIYHALRNSGGVPLHQVGMNVKQWIKNPASDLFQKLDVRKHEDFRGGFEPIPDVVIFKAEVGGDWRRRQFEHTLKNMLVAIEVKASERKGGRLRPKEIIDDIHKLAAHRDEVGHRGGDMHPVMMIIDVANNVSECMTPSCFNTVKVEAEKLSVSLYYVAQDQEISKKYL